MKIAITAENGHGLESSVSHHFGRCAYYVFVDVVDGRVGQVITLPNGYAASHAPGELPAFIQQNGVDVLLTGGMGRRAVEHFTDYGIEVVTGARGRVADTLQHYLAGELSGVVPCQNSREHAHNDCDHQERIGGCA